MQVTWYSLSVTSDVRCRGAHRTTHVTYSSVTTHRCTAPIVFLPRRRKATPPVRKSSQVSG